LNNQKDEGRKIKKTVCKQALTLALVLVMFLSLCPQSVAGLEPEPTPEHSHVYEETVTAPTCTDKGFTTHACACGDNFTDTETDALGHSWGEWADVEGVQQRSCSVCGATEPEIVEPSPTPEANVQLTSTGPQKLLVSKNGGAKQETMDPVWKNRFSPQGVVFYANDAVVYDDDLVCTGQVELGPWVDPDADFANLDGILALYGLEPGEGTISYTDGNGTVYSITITVKADDPPGGGGGGPMVFPFGLYSQPVRSDEYAIQSVPESEIGKELTFYLMWDEGVTPVDISVAGEVLTVTSVDTRHEAEGYWAITVIVPQTEVHFGFIYRAEGDVSDSEFPCGFPVGSEEPPNETPHILTVDISNNNTLSIGTGELRDNVLIFADSLGSYYEEDSTGDFWVDIYLVGIQNYQTNNETEATAEQYGYIGSVSPQVIDWVNHDGNTETPNCQISAVENVTVNGVTTKKFTVSAGNKKGFTAIIGVEVQLELPDGLPRGDMLQIRVNYEPVPVEEEPDILGPETAAGLNHILSSLENLAAWYEATYDTAYTGVPFTMTLPAVVYDEVIVSNLLVRPGVGCLVSLQGSSENGVTTTMPGLLSRGCINSVSGINFVARQGLSMSATGGNSSFTCGIMADSGSDDPDFNNRRSVIGSVTGCSFSGFDYGIRSTDRGYVDGIAGNVFSGCKYGIYIDSSGVGKNIGPELSVIQNNTFQNSSDSAIMLEKLPQSLSAYRFRVTNNIFLGNSKDMKISGQSNKYYAYKNYFGAGNGANRTAALEANGNVIITNPRRSSQTTDDLYVDNSAGSTDILNNEANDLVISGDSLSNAADDTVVNILDGTAGSETVVGKWKFKGGKNG